MGEAREVMDRLTETIFRKDMEAVKELYAPDAIAETPDQGTIKGREGIAAWLDELMLAFPDASYESLRKYESGDTAIDEGFLVGTHTGPLASPEGEIPATGKSVRVRECDAATVQNGRITRHSIYSDQMDLLGQLGLVPEAQPQAMET